MTPRVLLFDIETAPLRGYAWRPWDTNLIQVTEDWRLLSVAWKWKGERGVRSLTTEAEEDDEHVAAKLYELFDAANVVVAHNADKFDIPKANARMAFWGLSAPSPYKVLDTLKLARRHFAFTSNRLDDLCQHLGLGRKLPHTGFSMWEGCMENNPSAWRLMRRYNKHDVVLLDRLHDVLLPWSPTHPNLALIAGKPDACPRCLADPDKLIVRGYRHYQTGTRVQYQCNACRSYCASRRLTPHPVTHVS